MHEREFDKDPLTGAIETFSYDDVNDTFTIARAEDIEPLMEMNKYISNETPGNWRGDVHRVASIPATVVQELRQKGILNNPERLRVWLNDPENRVFRTRPGQV
jgi:hypothetical protein